MPKTERVQRRDCRRTLLPRDLHLAELLEERVVLLEALLGGLPHRLRLLLFGPTFFTSCLKRGRNAPSEARVAEPQRGEPVGGASRRARTRQLLICPNVSFKVSQPRPRRAPRPSALRLGLNGLKRVAAQRILSPPKPPLPPKLPRTSCKPPRSSAALLPRPTLSTLSTLTNPKTAALNRGTFTAQTAKVHGATSQVGKRSPEW